MKKLLFIVPILVMPQIVVRAQEPEQDIAPRNLKLMIRNTRGKVMRDFQVRAFLNGDSVTLPLDKFGNRYFSVVDTDTLSLMLGMTIYEIPVAGMDSVYVAFKNRNKIAGLVGDKRAEPGSGSINTGYGIISRKDNNFASGAMDMTEADNNILYRDLRRFIEGRVPGVTFFGAELRVRGASSEPLFVIDGIVRSISFETLNAMVLPKDVASITVLKDGAAAMYGSDASNGVVVITTKTGLD